MRGGIWGEMEKEKEMTNIIEVCCFMVFDRVIEWEMVRRGNIWNVDNV